MFSRIMTVVIWITATFLILFLVSILTKKRFEKRNVEAVIVFGISSIALLFPLFKIGNYNWIGKLQALIIEIVIIFAFYRKSEMLKNLFCTPKISIFDIISITVFLVLSFISEIPNTNSVKIDLEEIFFDLTMPGIQEEILYRGLIMTMLCFIYKTENSKNKAINVGLIVSSIIFGLSHAAYYGNSFNLDMLISFIGPLIAGLYFGFLYYRTKSLIVPIIIHGISNVLMDLGKYI